MADFKIAHARTQIIEGFYSNDPVDKGGETIYGVARKANPTWMGWRLVDEWKKKPGFPKNMCNDQVLIDYSLSLFKQNYWNQCALDYVIDQDVANEIYDCSVNFGPEAETKIVQRSLNRLNKKGKLFPELKVDGDFGPKTRNTLNGFRYKEALLKTLNGYQFMRYDAICQDDETQEKFFHGWLTRVEFQKETKFNL